LNLRLLLLIHRQIRPGQSQTYLLTSQHQYQSNLQKVSEVIVHPSYITSVIGCSSESTVPSLFIKSLSPDNAPIRAPRMIIPCSFCSSLITATGMLAVDTISNNSVSTVSGEIIGRSEISTSF